MAEALIAASSKSDSADGELERLLGPGDAAAIMVSNMVGVGILTLPGLVALAFGNAPLALMAWAFVGLLSLAGALVHAELGCRLPRAGGDYVFLREAFGRLPAFLSGWTSFVVGFPGAIAVASLAAASALFDAAGMMPSRWTALGAAAGVALLLTLLHAAGLRWGRRVQNVLAVIKVVLLVAIAGAAAVLPAPSLGEAAPAPGRPPGIPEALVFIFFAYTGWNASAYVAGEVREPRRTLPRALAGGVLAVTVLYLAVNAAYVYVVPPEERAAVNIGGHIAAQVFGPTGGRLLSVGFALVLIGSASAMIITGPRIYYAMARDGLFPRRIAALGRRSRAPVAALWLQTLWAVGLLLGGGALAPPGADGSAATVADSLERVVAWTAFAILPFAALTTSTVFVFRRRDRRLGREPAFPAPFHPWAALAFVAAALAVGIAFLIGGDENRENALLGSLLVTSGLPVYWLSVRLRR